MGKIRFFLLSFLIVFFISSSLFAAQGDKEAGRKIYDKKCWWCHGEKGEGNGPAAEFLLPPPRDFTLGVYK